MVPLVFTGVSSRHDKQEESDVKRSHTPLSWCASFLWTAAAAPDEAVAVFLCAPCLPPLPPADGSERACK